MTVLVSVEDVTSKKTLREVLDYIKEKTLKQGEQCIDDKGDCQYRDAENKKCCAWGWMIPDEYFDKEEMHNVIISKVIPDMSEFYQEHDMDFMLEEENVKLFEDIQSAHDCLRYTQGFCVSFKSKFNKAIENHEEEYGKIL